MRLVIFTLFVVFLCGTALAQDTLRSFYKEQPTQLQSWHVVKVYHDKPLYNGDFVQYFSNGEVKQTGGYSMGQLHGNNSTFNTDGTLNIKCRYTNGILNGEYKVFYASGNLKERRVYINGKLQGDYKFFKDKKDAEPYLIEKYKMGQKQ